MYSVNGVPLSNPTYGWRFRAISKILTDGTARTQSVIVPGVPGVATLSKQPDDAPMAFIVVQLNSMAERGRLMVLMKSKGAVLTLTSDPSKQVAIEYQSHGVNTFDSGERIVEITFIVRLNDVYWRDTTVTTSAAALISSSPFVTQVMSGLTEPVIDAVVRLTGPIQAPKVMDTLGSFFSYAGAVAAGSYLRFESATGLAYITTTNTWSGGTPVTVAYGPHPFLRLTPKYGATIAAELTVTSTSRSAPAAIEVRGQRAFTS